MNQYLKIYRYGFLYGFPAGQFLLQAKVKTRYPLRDNGFHWSCWADSNCRPHPYQLPFDCFLLFYLSVSYRRYPLRRNGFAVFFIVACCKILSLDVAPFNLYVAPFVAPFFGPLWVI